MKGDELELIYFNIYFNVKAADMLMLSIIGFGCRSSLI